MTNDVTDRRVQKTRKLLKDALVALIIEKGFESVTIQEILDKANVGRSTFYLHFENKQELLHSCFEEFHELFNKSSLESSNTLDSISSEFTLNILRLVERNQMLCKALLGQDDMTMYFNPIHSFIYDYFEVSIKKFVTNSSQTLLQSEMLGHYITSAFLGTLRWWVYNDMPYSVEEVNEVFKKLALRDIHLVMN